jgi:hypothetical protein
MNSDAMSVETQRVRAKTAPHSPARDDGILRSTATWIVISPLANSRPLRKVDDEQIRPWSRAD